MIVLSVGLGCCNLPSALSRQLSAAERSSQVAGRGSRIEGLSRILCF